MAGKNKHIMMVRRMLTLAVFAFAVSVSAQSQTAKDYFVGGAQLYVNGESERAKSYVDQGISVFPDDKKLIALRKAMDEENKDNKNQKDQDKNKDQQKDQDKQQDQKDKQQQEQQQGISKDDAQRLLDALANDEKKVQEKVKKEKAARGRVKTVINW